MRMRKVAEIVVESQGTKSVSAAIKESGLYAPSTAENPQYLTKSKTWADLMEEYLPEDAIAKAHKKLLNAKTPILQQHTFIGGVDDKTIKELIESMADCHLISIKDIFPAEIKATVDGEEVPEGPAPVSAMRVAYYSAPDNRARKDAIDIAYKLRGSYAAEKHLVGHFSLADLRRKREERDKLNQGL